MISLTFDSNPFAYGAIHARMEGRKSSIGGTSFVNGVVKGYFLGELVYEGDNEQEAMSAVEKKFNELPTNVQNALKDREES